MEKVRRSVVLTFASLPIAASSPARSTTSGREEREGRRSQPPLPDRHEWSASFLCPYPRFPCTIVVFPDVLRLQQ
ncbi:unnamed protein product [Linum trigynum]|uniref:Secreted protein n=1 Tax=Linum trigynum TaxID=586398 RepID=A0AAV2GPJ9_9ROSI